MLLACSNESERASFQHIVSFSLVSRGLLFAQPKPRNYATNPGYLAVEPMLWRGVIRLRSISDLPYSHAGSLRDCEAMLPDGSITYKWSSSCRCLADPHAGVTGVQWSDVVLTVHSQRYTASGAGPTIIRSRKAGIITVGMLC